MFYKFLIYVPNCDDFYKHWYHSLFTTACGSISSVVVNPTAVKYRNYIHINWCLFMVWLYIVLNDWLAGA